ncbi:helix-turn-helix domain-containing protein [Paenibacillus gallinarum]|uniref:Helix-turn-helix domain-containing protein n=1 Tax=Paenibacillus gallinarum TaxID=2762232 RepID=A0ABR8T6L3_9BACL|nr:helix-turn-helix domain-containing protein [Paenibacillus gallinarum]MBD7971391.1 helix-turn-helix domain-containing protein [Paenibacillus gallinarum]
MKTDRKSSTNTIIRTSKRENPYVMIDKYGLNDERLSWKAKGLLAYLLSKPDDWQVYESDLIKRATDGRDSVRTGLRELEKFGYLSRRQIRGENGSFGHVEYIIYERPVTEDLPDDGKSVDGKKPMTENPSTDFPSTENPLLLNNDLNNNDLNNDCLIEAATEIAVSELNSESFNNEIHKALSTYLPESIYLEGIPAGSAYVEEIFLMLQEQFPNQLDPEVIRIAADRYFDRTAYLAPDAPNGVKMKIDVRNPIGLFNKVYSEAIQLYKIKANRKQ